MGQIKLKYFNLAFIILAKAKYSVRQNACDYVAICVDRDDFLDCRYEVVESEIDDALFLICIDAIGV
jgi:hypothetical protein